MVRLVLWFNGKKVEGKKLWKPINELELELVQIHQLVFVIFSPSIASLLEMKSLAGLGETNVKWLLQQEFNGK
jgi:hypothetical protein